MKTFVTNAYKQKLAERSKWLEEERLRGRHEEKYDVENKSDLIDFYFNLNKNVAFGPQWKIGGTMANAEETIRPSRLKNKEIKISPDLSEDSTGHASSRDPVFLVPQEKIKVAATSSGVDRKQTPSKQNNNINELFKELSEDKKADQTTGSIMDGTR